jgi:sugar phosphate isomerase/epimerase
MRIKRAELFLSCYKIMNESHSRRDFLKRASVLPLAATGVLGLGEFSAGAAIKPIDRVGGSSLKVSCNAYSFAKQLGTGGKGPLSLLAFAEFCAKANFDAFDPTGYYFPGYEKNGTGVPTDQFIFELKRRAFDLGLCVSGTGIGNNFTTADKAARANDVQRIKNWIEVAAKLGAPVIRVFADTQMRAQTWQTVSNGATRDEVEKWIADDIRACADYGAKFGVIVGVQNHGDFIRTADDQIALLKRIDSPWCGAIVDTGYYRAPDPYAEMAKAAPYAVNWQVKQGTEGVENEASAPIDLIRLLKIVRASGYRGNRAAGRFPRIRLKLCRIFSPNSVTPSQPRHNPRSHAVNKFFQPSAGSETWGSFGFEPPFDRNACGGNQFIGEKSRPRHGSETWVGHLFTLKTARRSGNCDGQAARDHGRFPLQIALSLDRRHARRMPVHRPKIHGCRHRRDQHRHD